MPDAECTVHHVSPPRKTRKRLDIDGTARFLTCSCYNRLPLFANDRIKDVFLQHFCSVTHELSVAPLAWVVMPEHIHLVVHTEQADGISGFMFHLKRRVAAVVLGRWRELDAKILTRVVSKNGGHHFWQPGGGYDRNVFGEELIEKIRYCHANPVTRGLVDRAVDWRWSSARHYERFPDADGPEPRFDLLPDIQTPVT